MNARQRSAALQAACLALALLLLWGTFGELDLTALGTRLDDVAVIASLVILPFGLVNLVDAMGWQWLLHRLGAAVRLSDVYVTQLAGEAAILSLPLGFAVSEPLRPFLLGRRARVAIDTAVASTLARKAFLILAEGLVLALACLLGASTFQRVSQDVIGTGGLEWLTAGVAVLLCVMGLGMGLVLGRGAIAGRVLATLQRVTPRRLARFFDKTTDRFTDTDRALARFFSKHPLELCPGLAWYVLVWLLEALEAYVVLHALGAPVTFVEALSMEAALSFLRSLVVILPAGLGVQDLGYVLFLRALGVSDPLVVGAAFSVVKRCKEGLWIAIGYGCLAIARRKPPPALAGAFA